MKIALLVSIARQVQGEYVFVNIVKANKSATKLREYLDETDLPRASKINDVDCVVEYGIFDDVTLDDD